MIEKPGLYINGAWSTSEAAARLRAVDPSTEECVAGLPEAARAALEDA